MRISKLEDNKIYVEIPLTSQSGKARVKIRDSFYEYGLQTATKQNPFSQKYCLEENLTIEYSTLTLYEAIGILNLFDYFNI